MAAQERLTPVKVLDRTRNSPMKPFSSGRPMRASEVMTKRVARAGARWASPPKVLIWLVPKRS